MLPIIRKKIRCMWRMKFTRLNSDSITFHSTHGSLRQSESIQINKVSIVIQSEMKKLWTSRFTNCPKVWEITLEPSFQRIVDNWSSPEKGWGNLAWKRKALCQRYSRIQFNCVSDALIQSKLNTNILMMRKCCSKQRKFSKWKKIFMKLVLYRRRTTMTGHTIEISRLRKMLQIRVNTKMLQKRSCINLNILYGKIKMPGCLRQM